jgi:PERQ amino acid-rich with GYF domain-containing protein
VITRKLSFTGTQSGPLSPRDGASPRTRFTPGFDGVLNSGGGESWMAARRRASEALKPGGNRDEGKPGGEIKEEEENPGPATNGAFPDPPAANDSSHADLSSSISQMSIAQEVPASTPPQAASPPLDLAAVEWSYLDPQGQEQGGL